MRRSALTVIKYAEMSDKARPSQPMCNSHSLRFQIRDLGVPRGTVDPGTNRRAIMAIRMIGAAVFDRMRFLLVTVS